MHHEQPVFTRVAGHQRVGRNGALEFGNDPLGQNRRGLRPKLRGVEKAVLTPGRLQPGFTLGDGLGGHGLVGDQGFAQLGQGCFGVADQGHLGRIGPRGVFGLNVNLDQALALGVEQLGGFKGGIGCRQLGADHQHEVGRPDFGVGQGGAEVAVHAQSQLVGFGKATLTRGAGGDRGADFFGQGDQFHIGLRDPHPVAGDDHRSLGLGQSPGGLFHQTRIGRWSGNRQKGLGGVQGRNRLGTHPTPQRLAVQQHGHRSPLAG